MVYFVENSSVGEARRLARIFDQARLTKERATRSFLALPPTPIHVYGLAWPKEIMSLIPQQDLG
jgi:hypothetical protein